MPMRLLLAMLLLLTVTQQSSPQPDAISELVLRLEAAAMSGDRAAVRALSTSPAESVLLLTGYRADLDFLSRAGVEVNTDTAEPHYDSETFETNVPNWFDAGGQLAGNKTGSVFIENGRFHGERIARVVAERLAPSLSARSSVSVG